MATDRTVYVGNIGKEVDNTTLGHLFQHCGQVINIRIAGEPTYETRYAFVEFGTDQAAETAQLLDGMDVFGRKIRVSFARGGGGPGIVRSNDPDRVTRTVHIGGFPMEDVNEEQLAEYFSHVGEVMAVRKSGRFAWIEFSTLKAAQQALQLDGETMGNGTLKVQQSKTPIMSAGWRAAPKLGKPTLPTGPLPAPAPSSAVSASYAPPSASSEYTYPAPPYSAVPTSAPLYSAPPASFGAPPPGGPPPTRPPGPRPPPGPPPQHLPGPPPAAPYPGGAPPAYPPPAGMPPAGYQPPPAGPPQAFPGPPPQGSFGGPPSSAYAPQGAPPSYQ